MPNTSDDEETNLGTPLSDDLGLLIPTSIVMLIIMAMHPIGVFTTIALAFILFGSYFSLTVPLVILKVISLYAVLTAINPCLLVISTFFLGLLLIVLLFYLFF
ncbi:hypothetical protein [Desulfotalea psychrophila]|uniref:Related to sulfate permease, N-terminal fraction only n=1 Tax=Desulfotalea psychrophila (strain LSv54 / DSM 12343) TaxID=177439 RepID=Q6ARK9_DESPS|nr:hypothetical protein [Desulfotalea psychrophila]CAG35016.1 related to sulfate permease, N-terminal fraction only [Desulfotalea psychrophila LSv54]